MQKIIFIPRSAYIPCYSKRKKQLIVLLSNNTNLKLKSLEIRFSNCGKMRKTTILCTL